MPYAVPDLDFRTQRDLSLLAAAHGHLYRMRRMGATWHAGVHRVGQPDWHPLYRGPSQSLARAHCRRHAAGLTLAPADGPRTPGNRQRTPAEPCPLAAR